MKLPTPVADVEKCKDDVEGDNDDGRRGKGGDDSDHDDGENGEGNDDDGDDDVKLEKMTMTATMMVDLVKDDGCGDVAGEIGEGQ